MLTCCIGILVNCVQVSPAYLTLDVREYSSAFLEVATWDACSVRRSSDDSFIWISAHFGNGCSLFLGILKFIFGNFEVRFWDKFFSNAVIYEVSPISMGVGGYECVLIVLELHFRVRCTFELHV